MVAYGRWSLTRSGRYERVDCIAKDVGDKHAQGIAYVYNGGVNDCRGFEDGHGVLPAIFSVVLPRMSTSIPHAWRTTQRSRRFA